MFVSLGCWVQMILYVKLFLETKMQVFLPHPILISWRRFLTPFLNFRKNEDTCHGYWCLRRVSRNNRSRFLEAIFVLQDSFASWGSAGRREKDWAWVAGDSDSVEEISLCVEWKSVASFWLWRHINRLSVSVAWSAVFPCFVRTNCSFVFLFKFSVLQCGVLKSFLQPIVA